MHALDVVFNLARCVFCVDGSQVLIMCDNPSCHGLTQEQLAHLANMGIDYLCFPHNTTQLLQPCDQEIFSVFQQDWKACMLKYIADSRGKVPGKWELLSMLTASYEKATKAKHVRGAFKTCGFVLDNLDEAKKAQEAAIVQMESRNKDVEAAGEKGSKGTKRQRYKESRNPEYFSIRALSVRDAVDEAGDKLTANFGKVIEQRTAEGIRRKFKKQRIKKSEAVFMPTNGLLNGDSALR